MGFPQKLGKVHDDLRLLLAWTDPGPAFQDLIPALNEPSQITSKKRY